MGSTTDRRDVCRYFDGKRGFRRVYAVYGNTNDYYMTLTRGYYKLDKLLAEHLKLLGYQVVVFCDGTQKLRCYDRAHAEMRRRLFPLKHEEKNEAGTEKPSPSAEKVEKRVDGAGTAVRRSAIKLPDRGRVSGKKHPEHAAEVSDTALLEFECPVDNLPSYLTRIMSCEEAKCAVVFSDATFLFDGSTRAGFSTSIRSWYALKPNNTNIAILLFQAPKLEALPDQLKNNSQWGFLYENLFTESSSNETVIHIGNPQQDEVFYLLNAKVPDFRNADKLRELGADESTVLAAGLRLVLEKGGKLYDLKRFVEDHPGNCVQELLKAYGACNDEDALEHIRNTEGWEEVARVVSRIINDATQAGDPREQGFDENCFTNLRLASDQGAAGSKANMCMVLKGFPGTGKTTAAEYIGRALRQKGLLPSGHFVKVERKDLVAGYVGQTALKTQAKLDEARGGVLLVDEAYELNRKNSDGSTSGDFGEEAIETLMNAILGMRGQICIIFAGYPEEMDAFLKVNPGLPSRLANNIITIEEYDAGKLERISLRYIARCNSKNEKSGSYVRFYIDGALGNNPEGERAQDKYDPAELVERTREDRKNNRPLCPFSVYFDNMVADKDEHFGNGRVSVEEAKLLMASARTRAGTRSRDVIISKEDFPAEKQKYFVNRANTIEALRRQMNEIVGMERVKKQFISLANGMVMSKVRRQAAMLRNRQVGGNESVPKSYLFVGNPGVGKTMIAQKLAQLLCMTGIVRRYDPVRVQGNDLISMFQRRDGVGQIKEFLKQHNGSVIIIDEAHQLGQYNLGSGVLQALLDPLAGDDGDLQVVVVFNCYPNQVKQLLGTEQGIGRRIDASFYFDDYMPEAVCQIFKLKLKERGLSLDEEGLGCVLAKLEELKKIPGYWENGGTAEKLLNNASECMNDRIVSNADSTALIEAIERGEMDESALYTLTVEDIEQGYDNLLEELRITNPAATTL